MPHRGQFRNDCHGLAFERGAPVEVVRQRRRESFRPLEGGACKGHSCRLPRPLERETPSASHGRFAGRQVCVSTQRIYFHADIERIFLDRFAARVAALKVGDPILAETEVGPLIHPREADRVTAWIREAEAGGASVIGGGRLTDTTLLPAIIVSPLADAKVSTLEVFGPITCVNLTKLNAIAATNALPMAFQASIFTEGLRTGLRAAERLGASAVMINDHTAFRTDWMPFAGRRHSG